MTRLMLPLMMYQDQGGRSSAVSATCTRREFAIVIRSKSRFKGYDCHEVEVADG
jgi:hypothetical protein